MRRKYNSIGFNRRLGFARLKPRLKRLYQRVLPHNLRVTGGPSTAGQARNAVRMFVDSCAGAEIATEAAGDTIEALPSSITTYNSSLTEVGGGDNLTGLLTVANKFQRYLVTGWKAWYRFGNLAAGSTNNSPLYLLWIPHHKYNSSHYAALANESARWQWLMCHPYAKKTLLPVGSQSQTKEVVLYMSRARSNALDKFDDLRDDVSGSLYSGGLTVDNTGVGDPAIVDEVPASDTDVTVVPEATDTTRANLNIVPWVMFLVPGVGGAARPAVFAQVRLRKYVLFYDPIAADTQGYTYSTS